MVFPFLQPPKVTIQMKGVWSETHSYLDSKLLGMVCGLSHLPPNPTPLLAITTIHRATEFCLFVLLFGVVATDFAGSKCERPCSAQ